MHYVYLLKSVKDKNKTYVGYTTDLQKRLSKHNEGGSVHTRNDKPWELVACIGVDSKQKALSFEKYLKSGSGYAFAKKRFW